MQVPLQDPRPYLEDFKLVASTTAEAAHEAVEVLGPPATAAVKTAVTAGRAAQTVGHVTYKAASPLRWLMHTGGGGASSSVGAWVGGAAAR